MVIILFGIEEKNETNGSHSVQLIYLNTSSKIPTYCMLKEATFHISTHNGLILEEFGFYCRHLHIAAKCYSKSQFDFRSICGYYWIHVSSIMSIQLVVFL